MMMRLRLFFSLLLLIATLTTGAGIGLAETIQPTASQTLAQQTVEDDVAAIEALVAEMENAIAAADAALYLSYVDLSDPIFALEHTRMTDDWADFPVLAVCLRVRDIVVDGDEATGEMLMIWVMDDQGRRYARYAVRFTRDEDGAWFYAGELWVTTETENFAVHAAPQVDESIVEAVIAYLPAVYTHVTTSLDFEPEHIMHIKIYTDPDALVANTLLSLPPISGWNEPGESLKVRVMDRGEPPAGGVVAHEFGHFVNFEMGETATVNTPWWLMEGLAEHVSLPFRGEERIASRFAFILEAQRAGNLPDLAEFNSFHYAETPIELWGYVYAGGLVFVSYVTDTYGLETRNAWYEAMANDRSLEEATVEVLDTSLDELDQDFRDWLDSQ